MEIGLINGNKVEFGATENGFVYKNTKAFENQTDEICYIPEYGLDDDDTITDDSSTFTYKDFLKMSEEYVKRTGISNTPQDIAEQLFDLVDWQFPTTLLDEWEIHLDEEE